MDLDKLIEVCKEGYLIGELIGVSGFGEKTCTKIQRGINSKLNTIEFLLKTLSYETKKNLHKCRNLAALFILYWRCGSERC